MQKPGPDNVKTCNIPRYVNIEYLIPFSEFENFHHFFLLLLFLNSVPFKMLGISFWRISYWEHLIKLELLLFIKKNINIPAINKIVWLIQYNKKGPCHIITWIDKLQSGKVWIIYFEGLLVDSQADWSLRIEKGLLVVEGDRIVERAAVADLPRVLGKYQLKEDEVIYLTESQFLLPGLIDTHIHASQFPNAGVR